MRPIWVLQRPLDLALVLVGTMGASVEQLCHCCTLSMKTDYHRRCLESIPKLYDPHWIFLEWGLLVFEMLSDRLLLRCLVLLELPRPPFGLEWLDCTYKGWLALHFELKSEMRPLLVLMSSEP